MQQQIAQTLKTAIAQRQISIEALAKAAGINKGAIYRIINAQNYQIASLAAIAKVLNINLAQMAGTYKAV